MLQTLFNTELPEKREEKIVWNKSMKFKWKTGDLKKEPRGIINLDKTEKEGRIKRGRKKNKRGKKKNSFSGGGTFFKQCGCCEESWNVGSRFCEFDAEIK